MSLATLSAAPQARSAAPTRYLYRPIVDFLLLGGGSLIVLPLLALAYPGQERPVVIVGFSLMLAHVINHPHFTQPPALRIRYLIAGAIVPLLLAAYFCIAIISSNLIWLGLAANLTLLVGWHYVKQGYGMLIVDCV